MAISILLPKLGLTMQEGTIEEWVATPGAAVRHGDVLLRLATDKVDVEVEAEGEGVFHPAVPAGVTLPPGTLIGWLLAPGEAPPGAGSPDAGSRDAGSRDAGSRDAGSPGDGAAGVGIPTDGSSPAANGHALAVTAPASSPTTVQEGLVRLRVSPNARRVAARHGVDLALLRGTGPDGRIVSEDVEDFLAARSAPAARPAPAPTSPLISPLVRRHAESLGVDPASVAGTGAGGRIRRADIDAAALGSVGETGATGVNGAVPAGTGIRVAGGAGAYGPASTVGTQGALGSGDARLDGEPAERIPLTGMRGTIARRMHASLQEAAQLTLGYEVRMDAVLSLRDRLKEELAGTDLPVPSLTDFVVRAAALALRDHPRLNAAVRDDHIEVHSGIHVGLAVAVPRGLVVPVIRDTADRALSDLARETRDLAEAARAGRLPLAQLEGATFAVTTLGMYGVDFFTPIINPGNVAILGVGRIRDGVTWEGESPRRTRVLTLSLTFDHRAVDGAPAAAYLKSLDALLQAPLRLLL